MPNDLPQQAIEEALSGNWKNATKLNLEILSRDPKNIDALNRLSRAYYECGHCKKALTLTKKVLKIDPQNPIAQKCSLKYKHKKTTASAQSKKFASFIEIPGKTKTVPLINIGSEENLSTLCPGEQVELKLGLHRVTVLSSSGKHIGRIPDNISAILISQKTKGLPEAFVKSYSKSEIKIFMHLTTDGQNFPQT